MVLYCPRCEDYVNLQDVHCTEDNATYYQCENCFMVLCFEKLCCNMFDPDMEENIE